MTDTEITLFGDLLNSFKENAYRTENSGVTGEGVFKTAYDNLLNAYSEYANLLDKYERKLDIDWISILKIARTLGSQEEIQINSETVEELKPQVIEILTTIYGEEETRDLTTKIDDIVTSLENFENSDSAVLEEKVDALLENVANVEIVVDLLETLDVTIPVIDSTTITEEVVNNKIDALEISDELKASLKNIFGVNVGV